MRTRTTSRIHLALGCWRKNPAARRSDARRSLPARRSSDGRSCTGLSSTWTGAFTSSSSSYCGDILTGSATLFSSQKCAGTLLGFTQRAGQRQLGHIVLIERLYIRVICRRYSFLRLHYFQTSGNSGGIAVL